MFAVSILNLVLPRGIEPRSPVLQTGAMTTSAKAAIKLASPEGLEPPLTVLETAVLPLHQRDINWSPHEDLNPDRLAPNQERYQVTLWRVNFYKKEIVLRPLLLAYAILPFIAAAQQNLCPLRKTHSFNLKDFSTLSPFHQPR